MTARFEPCPPAVRWIVLAGVLVSSACTRTTGPKSLTTATYAATRKAVAAIQDASKYRNATDSVFEPKLQAASAAADEVFHTMSNQTPDAYAANQVWSCIGDLKAYRTNFESRESATRPIEEQLKGIKASQMKDENDVLARNAKELDDCIADAKSYL